MLRVLRSSGGEDSALFYLLIRHIRILRLLVYLSYSLAHRVILKSSLPSFFKGGYHLLKFMDSLLQGNDINVLRQ